MNEKYRVARLHILEKSIVKMMMTAGISFAAIHFGRISVMWFYLIPAVLMGANYTRIKVNNDEE